MSQHFMFQRASVGFNGSTFIELKAMLAIVTVRFSEWKWLCVCRFDFSVCR